MILVSDSGLDSGGFWQAELMRVDGALCWKFCSHDTMSLMSDINTDIIPEYTLLTYRNDTELLHILLGYSVQ